MTKTEALQALSEGEKLTHYNFTPTEWIKQIGSDYLFEDGVKCSYSEFWRWRTNESWNNGWEIFSKNVKSK